MKTACLVSVLLAIVLASHAATVPPASLKFFISHDAVVGLQNVVNPFLMAALKGLSIPDQSASALGIHIYLTEIVITEFTFTDQTVTFVPPNIININMPSITAQLTMNWEYKDGWLIDWTGSAVDTVSSTSASISLAVGTDSQGHATMNVASVDLSIGSLDIDLHGDHSSIFQFVVNLITPILKKVVQSEVGNVMQSKVSAMLASMFATIPIQINNVMPNVAVNFGLLPTTNVRGMQGTYYSNNHFSGSGSPVTYSDMSHINLGDYDSFDVTGYYQPPVSGNYAFQLHLDQRGQISINGFTAGELETWNIGMCWPETNTYTTSVMYLDASQYYPLRVQYQSGCGGGWVETNVCPNGTNCESISPLSITNSPNGEVPITIWPNNIELCSATTGVYMPTGATSNAPHHAAPDTPFSDNMIDITLDDYIFNSLAWAAYEAGDLQKLVTSLPPQSPFQLNTTDFEGMIPDLYAHYPNDAMTLLISANSPPVVTVSQQSAINIAADLGINISVIANGTSITCIELDAALNIQAKAFFNSSNGTLCADINNFTLTLNEVWGPIYFNSTLLNPFFNAIISGSVIPMINQKLNAGIAIPVIDGVTLGNAVIGYDDHIITLGTDFVYQPTASFIAALMPPAALAQVAALPSNNLA